MLTGSLKRLGLAAGLAACAALLPQCHLLTKEKGDSSEPTAQGYQYIVVGSGAGGGPLAARLALAGKRVLLLEAGEDVGDRLSYQVPAMHALSTEDAAAGWWYFVQHHHDVNVDKTDSKYTPQGILYPRGSALGGSTAVNAMVTVLPSRSDWDRLADLTADRRWRADAMDMYIDRVNEWLGIELPDPNLALNDDKVASFLAGAAEAAQVDNAGAVSSLSALLAHDVNNDLRSGETTGLYRLPLATKSGHRNGTREHLLDVATKAPLTIITGAFVTKVLWDAAAAVPTARGVEYVKQSAVYGASLARQDVNVDPTQVFASSEIILSAGTFNSPQLLLQSGIGQDDQLAKWGIPQVETLAGVGENLQDRYEAPVVSELDAPLDILANCRLDQSAPDDPCLDQWQRGSGVYQTPGFLATLLTRSTPDVPLADLQIFAVPTDARGYYPGYSKDSALTKNRFTWLLLKAHTNNHDGTVQLSGASPFVRPLITFNSYDENDPLHDPDLLALVEGVKKARSIAANMRALVPSDPVLEVWPGPTVASDADLAAWIYKESWGHHACCSNKMGTADDATAVVDSELRVIGTQNLRVVDASVFPEIPGTFIAMPTYMLAERAADLILGVAK